LGFLAACVVAFFGNRVRSLSQSGAVASVAVGTAAVAAGWSWGILLIAYFVVSAALSRFRARRKSRVIGAVVEKSGDRDATQVLANGALYAFAALAHVESSSPIWYALGIGALAASAADTWATELGTLSTRQPISIATGRRVTAGTSGGITPVGLLASLLGALFVAAGGALAGWPVPFTAVVLGGLVGALSDSLLGATLQTRRWCDACASETERVVHDCGNPTRRIGGLRGFDNDAVNLVCCAVGALVTLLLSWSRAH
jgi:uncharacterized protein (TIGR00297 family)